MSRPEVSVILPVFNEAENLPLLWQEMEGALAKLGRPAEVIFVDDGSTDDGPGLVRDLTRQDARVRLVRLERNVGLTAALLAGFECARGRIVVTMDSDLQYDPQDMPALVALAERFDAAIGRRGFRADPWLKRVSSRIANAVRSAVLGDRVVDSACTFRAMRRECLSAIAPYHGMHRFVPTLLLQAGFSIVRAEVHHRPRRHGRSKYGVRNRALRAFVDLLAVRWMLSRRAVYRIVEDTAQAEKTGSRRPAS